MTYLASGETSLRSCRYRHRTRKVEEPIIQPGMKITTKANKNYRRSWRTDPLADLRCCTTEVAGARAPSFLS